MRRIKGSFTKEQYIQFLREERAAWHLGAFYYDIKIGNWSSDGQYIVVDFSAPETVKELVFNHLQKDGWTVERKQFAWQTGQSIVAHQPKLNTQLVELK